ncbi:MAG: glycosyltransferase family 4 protein [Gammaproteobacteria bacterium]|nr:glycosyltransferase family 4 protein [Gammaproteobacteria bacterium]
MTAAPTLCLLVPSPLEQRTGGYIYDRQMVASLRDRGWTVAVPTLLGRFPDPDHRAVNSIGDTLAALPADTTALIDSLALPALAGAPASATRDRTIIALVHHLPSDETGLPPNTRHLLRSRERDALARVSGIIVTSAYTAERIAAAGGDLERIRVVVPGTDPAPASRGPPAGDPVMLLCVGSLVPRKGQDILVRALARERERRWRCVLAGSTTRDREFFRRVRRLVDNEGLGDRIEFAGECTGEEIFGLYDRASVFVLPSHFEGYGMALTEALIRGLPVISTTAGAIPHTVPGDAGILVPAGDTQALADAIASVVEGPCAETEGTRSRTTGRRESIAAAARRRAAILPDWERQARAFATALAELGSPTELPRS